MVTALYLREDIQGTFAQNIEFLGTDFTPPIPVDKSTKLIIQFLVGAGNERPVEFTTDGTTFFALNGGANLALGLNVFNIFPRGGDLINFRSPDALGISIRMRVISDING